MYWNACVVMVSYHTLGCCLFICGYVIHTVARGGGGVGHTSGFTQRGLPLTGDRGWGLTAGGIFPPRAFTGVGGVGTHSSLHI